MSQGELEKFIAVWPCPMQSVPSELYTRLDSIIIHQAETLGWRITLSELVRFRLSEWDLQENGPKLVHQFSLAWKRSVLILQGKELPPVEDPDHWAVKQETVRELRSILRKLRPIFAVMKKPPTLGEVFETFSKTVSDSPETYCHLKANLPRWLKFLEENRDFCRPILLGDRTPPASLYDHFLAWPSGWDPESLRQAISRLGSRL